MTWFETWSRRCGRDTVMSDKHRALEATVFFRGIDANRPHGTPYALGFVSI